MAEFIYNNSKNASTGLIPFNLNCGYHHHVFFEEDTNPSSKSKSADKLVNDQKDQVIFYWENLYYTQKLQKRTHNKGVKLRSYASGDKV